MGIRKQKPRAGQPDAVLRQRPVRREQLEKARQNAGLLNDVIDTEEYSGAGEELVRHRQQEIQQQLAQLRHEAVQARRLAEQIDSLSRDKTARKRRPRMNDTPTPDQGQSTPGRRTGDRTRSSGSQSHFNPLHPSMELPPEQMIRLLGLEDKKSRKKAKTTPAFATPGADKPVTARRAPALEDSELPNIEVPSAQPRHSTRRQRDMQANAFERRGSGPWRIATAIGVIAGIAASVYLFREGPPLQRTPVSPAARPAPEVAAKPAPPAKTLPARPRADRPEAVEKAPATAAATPRTAPASVAAPTEAASPVAENPQLRAAARAEEKRLRAEAEARLHAALQTAPPVDTQTAAEPRPAPPPVETPQDQEVSPAVDSVPETGALSPVAPPPVEEDEVQATDDELSPATDTAFESAPAVESVAPMQTSADADRPVVEATVPEPVDNAAEPEGADAVSPDTLEEAAPPPSAVPVESGVDAAPAPEPPLPQGDKLP